MLQSFAGCVHLFISFSRYERTIEAVSSGRRVMPVSYTHLDVYKRQALGETEEEVQYLMSKMFPSMVVVGFITVTITSVFIAGIFAGML